MRRTLTLGIFTAVITATLLLQASPSEAQRRRPVRRPHTSVVVSAGIHIGPSYRYYSPYFWGGPYGWFPAWEFYGPQPYYYRGPIDRRGSLRLQIMPREAQVYVDGFFAGTVDDFDGIFQRLHVRPGDHELVLYMEGYRTVRQNVRLAPGQDYKIRFTMARLPQGETSEPPPVSPPIRERRADPEGIEAPERDRETLPDRPPVPRDLPGRMPPERNEVTAEGFGTLSLRVQPAGAEVLVDGEPWQGPEGAERLVIQVAQGSHRVEIRKEGFVTFTTEVQVRPGDTLPLNVSLPRRD